MAGRGGDKRHRHTLRLHGPKKLIRRMSVAVIVPLLVLSGGATVLAINISRGSSSPAISTSPHWAVPGDELDAPYVQTPGGAASGNGGFNAVTCPTSEFCAAVGGSADLAAIASVSSNGGTSWVSSPLESGLPPLNAISCWNSSACVAVGEGVVIATSNAGTSWSPHPIPTSDTTLLSVSCPSDALCVGGGVSPGNAGPYQGQLLYSLDGGVKWMEPTLPATVGAVGSVACPTTSFCVAVGAEILVSTDGGESWSQRTVSGGTGVLRTVSCSSALDCVAIGPNPLGFNDPSLGALEVSTSDGGTTWEPNSMPAGLWMMNVVSCTANDECMAAGPSSSAAGAPQTPILVSTNNGTTWSSESPPTGVTSVGSLECQTATHCVFVGYAGSAAVFGQAPSSGLSTSSSSLTPLATTPKAASS